MRSLAATVIVFVAVGCTSAAPTTREVAERKVWGPGSECWQNSVSPASGEITFADVTSERGADQPLRGMMAHAAAAADVNGDGWLDLFVGTFATRRAESYRARGALQPAPDRLLLGGPKGFRVDHTFPGEGARTSGAAFADLDQDGDPDLIVARNVKSNRSRPGESIPSTVYRNDGARFVVAARVAKEKAARSIGVLDMDQDGLLDLFVSEDRFGGGSSVLLRNHGGFRFSDATAKSGIPRDVHGLGVAVADFDGDRRDDVFVSGSNRLFVARGARFEEVPEAVADWPTYGNEDDVAGAAVGDVNRDGRVDLVLGQHYNSTVDRGREVPIRVYRNEGVGPDGAPRLRDVTEAAGVPAFPTKAPHVQIADFDADGWPDIMATAAIGDGSRPAILRNVGTPELGFEAPGELGTKQYWVTGIAADFDRDGRADIFLAEWDAARPSLMLRNESSTGHWLEIEVPGGGIGGEVSVYKAGGLGDRDLRLYKGRLEASTGYGAGVPSWAHIGLGREVRVDATVQTTRRTVLRNVEADQHIVVGRCRR